MKQSAGRKRKPLDPELGIEELRVKLEEAEETLRAIRQSEVDGLLIEGARGKQVFTLKGADTTYRILIEAMNEGALVLNPKGVIVYANRRFGELIQRPMPEVTGSFAQEFIPSDLEPAFASLLEKSGTTPCQQEMVIRRADRSLVPVQLSASTVMLEKTRGVCLLVTDLSDQKRREEAGDVERRITEDRIRQHASELEFANKELESFVYSVSHDLRSPLRSLHRFGTMILEEHAAGLDATARDYLSRITGAAERMDDLICGLLEYSRVSRAAVQLHPVDTPSVLDEVIKQLQEELSGAELQILRPLPPVSGDVLLLSQVFTNLLSNALKFVVPGTKPSIKVWAEHPRPHVRIWIEDNGIGVAREHQGRLFQVFERINGKDFPGTGIGLAIVKRAVERMGGAVGVDSEPGKGSRFWVELRSISVS